MTYARTATALFGTLTAPSSIAASGQATVTLPITTPGSVLEAGLAVLVQMGSTPPSASPTVTFQYSPDGTTYVNDDRYSTLLVPLTASALFTYGYTARLAAQGARVLIANGPGQAIGAAVDGMTLATS